jgi:5-methylthioadenosine/S-adenosylhomocysteine deaminase
LALDLRDPDTQRVYQPLSQIVYAASRDQVHHVWEAGRQLVRDGVALPPDREAILTQAWDWGGRIAAADRRG